ncbi:ankyrin repeat domain-containing protein [Streptomyces hainanensis]|uniref:Ankyrin repeat domain-containing protein n=1 Tax=Streptomyces hainanensis TaxID=402648 RepID=A0A4V2Y3V9_9ACTN|nr:ankyrin repeat domain-containing protein [Streptomyces hainanensis]TDC78015.1 ankyrin repeat domain-containing protein [Streptomyces hainanensis]
MNRRRRKKAEGRLVVAAMVGEPAVVARLLRAGVSPEASDVDGMTALYAAAVHGDAHSVRLLLRAGAAPDRESAGVGSEGTPLCAAACWGHEDAVRELLAFGAGPEVREDAGTGLTPLEWARGGPHPGTEALLLAATQG